ncbi:MAG: hypothetical protein ACAI34_22510 [Verrucomicrobium sp.]|nr:hypothetical protein [Verrucomicrobium sp.]
MNNLSHLPGLAAVSRILFLATLAFSLSLTTAQAGELSADDTKAILARAEMVKVAFDKGDTDTIVKLTHPAIFKLTNGKEGFENITKQATTMISSMGIKILESSMGTPTKTYTAGASTVTFVPRTSVMSLKDKKIRTIGYLIAIKGGTEAPDWLFLDGAGLRGKPGLLKTLLPELPDDVKLPENKVEPVSE